MTEIFNHILALSQDFGYTGIIILMAIESSFIPFPSEVVIPPAAYLARSGVFNIWLVIGSGVLGSLIGAIFNYYIALWLGRPLVYRLAETRWAKMLLINRTNIEKAEDYFLRYGNWSTFFGRLIVAVRQLISLPAGFARMNLALFVLYTGLGSLLWISILALIGYLFGAAEGRLHQYYTEIKWSLAFLSLTLFAAYIYWQVRKVRSKKRAS